MRHLILLVAASVLVVACSHAAPTTPEADPLPEFGVPMFDFILVLPPRSTGTLHGMLFEGSTNGATQTGLKVGLEPQTHTMEGALYGSGYIYSFKLWTK